MTDPIEDDLLEYLRENFLPRNARQSLTPEADLLETATLDSVGLLSMVEYVEKRYGFRVADEDLLPVNFASIRVAAAFVRRRATVTPEGVGT